eukprot:5518932-Amphidinium_carterae.1
MELELDARSRIRAALEAGVDSLGSASRQNLQVSCGPTVRHEFQRRRPSQISSLPKRTCTRVGHSARGDAADFSTIRTNPVQGSISHRALDMRWQTKCGP